MSRQEGRNNCSHQLEFNLNICRQKQKKTRVNLVMGVEGLHLEWNQTWLYLVDECAHTDTLQQVERCRAESMERGLFGAVCLACTFDQSLERAEVGSKLRTNEDEEKRMKRRREWISKLRQLGCLTVSSHTPG